MIGVVNYQRWEPHGDAALSCGGSTPGALEIAAWLRDDIGYSLDTLTWWIAAINEVSRGVNESGYVGSGNAHHVSSASDSLLYIFCEYDWDQQVTLTCKQAVAALIEYRALLKSDWRNPTFRPGHFSIEYEAEGEAALTMFRDHGGKFPAEK